MTSDEVLKCPIPGACLSTASNRTNGSTCLEGNEGALCAVCAADHYRPSAYSVCEPCGDATVAALSAFGVFFAMVIALVVFVNVNRRAPNGLLRPFIDLVQKVTVMLLFEAPFPKALIEAGKVMSGLSFGVEVASPQCAGLGSGYYSLFGLTVVGLILMCLSMLAFPIIAKFKNGWTWGEMASSKIGTQSFRDLFVVVLLVYPTVSGKAMEFFRCRKIDGEQYLMADYSIKCYDSSWYAFLPVVLGVLIFFSAGTPLAIAYALYTRAKGLYADTGKAIPQPLDILFAIYQPNAYWFESVQMCFKLGLWSTLVFFDHGAVLQLATALVVNVMHLCVHLMILPFGGDDAWLLNRMQGAALVLTV